MSRQEPAHLPALDPRQRYTIDETALYLRISRAFLMQRIAAGLVVTITDGARRFVPGREIERLSSPPDPPPAETTMTDAERADQQKQIAEARAAGVAEGRTQAEAAAAPAQQKTGAEGRTAERARIKAGEANRL